MKTHKLQNVLIVIPLITVISCASKNPNAKNEDLVLLTKATKINVQKTTELDKKIKDLNASQIENKLAIDQIKKEVEQIRNENKKIKQILQINNSENRKIEKAIQVTIKSQEALIKEIETLKKKVKEKNKKEEMYAIPTVWLNVREKPSQHSKKVSILRPGIKKKIYGKEIDEKGRVWYKIDAGYISSSYTMIKTE